MKNKINGLQLQLNDTYYDINNISLSNDKSLEVCFDIDSDMVTVANLIYESEGVHITLHIGYVPITFLCTDIYYTDSADSTTIGIIYTDSFDTNAISYNRQPLHA